MEQHPGTDSKRLTRSPTRNLNELPDWAYLNRKDVARILGIDVTTLSRQVKAGKLPAPHLIGGIPRWRLSTIKDLAT